MQEKQKSWFRRHWILTSILGFLLLIIIIGAFSSDSQENSLTGNMIKEKASKEVIITNTNLLLPQEEDIEREWIIDGPTKLDLNDTGFIEASELKVSKTESFSGTSVIMKTFRFDSVENAKNYYAQQIETIDIRGVEELNLGDNCFGIDREVGLAGSAQGYCLEKNIVIYLKSASSSFMYVSDLKDFKRIIMKKI